MKNRSRIFFPQGLVALLALAPAVSSAQPSHEITTAQAKALCATQARSVVSVHDPSVVYHAAGNKYYIFGSHRGVAKTTDMRNWTPVTVPWSALTSDGQVTLNASNADAFHVPATTTIEKGGKSVTFGPYDAAAWNCALPADDGTAWTVDGNMWAPDIIYNPTMKKWCQYLSLNGPKWNSCIILLTADNIEGPYLYQGPVVFTGFRSATDDRISFHNTDLELVLGEQSSLPSRYAQGDVWGSYWPHAIDPCVFYDKEDKLWMVYGSWSGGIYALELNENNGLRDYDVVYASDYDTKKAAVTTDAYFGKKIAGGCYVSGEGPYVQVIDGSYYLFMSYGGYAPDGGYEMRVFKSDAPDGPYLDSKGTSAIFSSYKLNFGVNADTRGSKLMGAYNKWGLMNMGECAQGHNSAVVGPDGNTYLVYHTKFNDGTFGHLVRVHQLFMNEDGWPVASPFEYDGEKVGDAALAAAPQFSAAQIAGTYNVMLHKYSMNHADYEEVTPVQIKLTADGKITGAYPGTWSVGENNSYISLTLAGGNYKGVVVEQQLEPSSLKAIAITAMRASSGVHMWAYKLQDRDALAHAVTTADMPVKDGQRVSRHLWFYQQLQAPVDGSVRWTSSHPDIISSTGRFNSAGLTADVDVTLSATMQQNDWSWNETYQVIVGKEYIPSADWKTGILAYYNFNEAPHINAFDKSQRAILSAQGSGKAPSLEEDSVLGAHVLHQYFGASGNNSMALVPNPLNGETIDGTTISMWVKRNDDVAWDAIFSFYNASAGARLYVTGNSYVGFNNGTDWFDINHPASLIPGNIPVNKWALLTLTVSRTDGVCIYVDGTLVSKTDKDKFAFVGKNNGTDLTDADKFDYNKVIDFISSCPNFYLGYGSFWGSTDVMIDDLLIYNRALSRMEVMGLRSMSNRVYDFSQTVVTDIQQVPSQVTRDTDAVYNLSGVRVTSPVKGGLYVRQGKVYVQQ